MLYLDHAATTPLRPEAKRAMEPYLTTEHGNPSGLHRPSQRAKNAMEEARERIAGLLGAGHPLEVVFTGGGTEADNLAVKGAALGADGGVGDVVTTAVEHDAVLASARFVKRLGGEVTVVGVDAAGVVAPGDVAAAVGRDTAVVSVMAINNETGARQPVAKVADAARAANAKVAVHTDAVQAAVADDLPALVAAVDLLALAAHKFGGPKGVGLLYVRDGVTLEPVIHGGGQELDRRSGTHNVAGIVGMAAALEAAVADRDGFVARVGEARRRFEERLRSVFPDLVVSAAADRSVQHSHLRIPGVPAETMLVRLDQAGLAAAAGSACHSGAVAVSHVLAAMGVDEVAAGEYLRFSFGWTTSPEDGDSAADLVAAAADAVRAVA